LAGDDDEAVPDEVLPSVLAGAFAGVPRNIGANDALVLASAMTYQSNMLRVKDC
jgi:hypothetical protein